MKSGSKREWYGILAGMIFVFMLTVSSLRSYAWFSDREVRNNQVTIGGIAMEVEEPAFQQNTLISSGSVFSKDPMIRNTGSVSCYYRVKVVVPLFHGPVPDDRTEKKWKTVTAPLFSFSCAPEWKEQKDLAREVTKNGISCQIRIFDYTKKVLPGEVTIPLFTKVSVLNYVEGSLKDGQSCDLIVSAYAIQSEGTGSIEEGFRQYAIQNQIRWEEIE